MTIQIDMFEVQLGAGVLLQFQADGQTVRVLADAGVHAKGYAKDHVHQKLPDAFASLEDDTRRIDLVIGTHYDADHLLGLPSILSDPTYEIGEIWLPPVANEGQPHPFDAKPRNKDLLPLQLKADETGEILSAYLQGKARICDAVRRLEMSAGGQRKSRLFSELSASLLEMEPREPEGWRDYFKSHLDEAARLTGTEDNCHADEPLYDEEDEEGYGWPDRSFVRYPPRTFGLKALWEEDDELAEANGISLAFVRKRAAEDAISALALNEVVSAARTREIPIRCSIVPDGTPRRFIWRKTERRFEPNEVDASEGPEFTLLGPSDALVRKHWNKLPLGDYVAKLAYVAVPLRSITESNQLSYVCVFQAEGQKILICGDAGFNDFKPKPRAAFFPKLIKALEGLDVIQVAHHGGYNHSFYNGLLEARETGGPRRAFHLLSHATHDKSRPSDEFGLYIAQVRVPATSPVLLFTSEPQEAKVKDFKPLIGTVVGEQALVGDVRLRHQAGQWDVLAHAIKLG